MTEELKTCPFCGSTAALCNDEICGQSMYFVACDECGVITPCFENEADALAVWNKRA
ncbi:MAG: Lar family restriction alleviation protein [Synergistaceae bacterium]|nr:Lar family restriction alleviation protein [Synergistaceae bacterium]